MGAKGGTAALAVRSSNGHALVVNAEKLDLIRQTLAPDLTDAQLVFFGEVCNRLGLDPFKRQIHAVVRKTKNQDGTYTKRMVIQSGIDGLRSIAQRTGRYAGQLGPLWCGADGIWNDAWLKEGNPAAAKVAVLHKDFKEPLWAVARWASYAQYFNGKLSDTWAKMPDGQLAKCAEALALRRAFPEELQGLYAVEEGVGAAAEVVTEPPASRAPALTDEERGILAALHDSLPAVAQWKPAKKKAELERGFDATYESLQQAHVATCGKNCVHVGGPAAPSDGELPDRYEPGVEDE